MSLTNSTVHIGNFFREFKSFATSIERSSKDLKSYLENPPLSIQDGGASTNSIVDDMCEKVVALEEQVTRLNSYPGLSKASMSSLSFENIINSIMAVYHTNEEMKEGVVDRLEQYGYKRRQKEPINNNNNNNNNNNHHHAATIETFTHDNEDIFTNHTNNISTPTPMTITMTKDKDNNNSNSNNPPQTPLTKKNRNVDLLKTPTLEDFGISAVTRELISKDDSNNKKNTDNFKEPKPVKRKAQVSPLKEESFEVKKMPKIEPTSLSNETQQPTAPATQNSPPRMDNVDMNPRRERKKKKSNSSSSSTLFPLINQVTDEESSLMPDYVKHTMPLELLNRCISFINERITDRRFGTVEESRNSIDESNAIGENQITESQIREYLDKIKLGSKTKTLVLTLTKLKKITTEIKNGENIYTILDNSGS